MDNLNKSVKILYIFLIAYICLIPFYYYPASYFLGFKIPLIKYFPLILIAILSVISAKQHHFRIKSIREDKLALSILLYFFLTLLSGIGTAYYPISILKALYYAATGILIYFIISSWKLSTEPRVYLLRLIVFIGFLVSAYGIITLLFGKDLFFQQLQYFKSNLIDPGIWLKMGRISSSLGNPLFLGGVLSLLFPISVYLYLLNQKEQKFPDIFLIVQASIIFLGLILTFSVGALVGVIIFYLYYRTRIKKLYNESSDYKRVKLFLLFAAGLCCLILYVMVVNALSIIQYNRYVFGNLLGKIDFEKITNIQAISLRLDSLQYAVSFLQTASTFFGIGIGRIGAGENLLSRVSLDNYLCLSLIESGIFATVALLLVFWVIIKKVSKKSEDPISVFLFGSLIVFFINMLFFDALNQPVIRILFWSFIGFLV